MSTPLNPDHSLDDLQSLYKLAVAISSSSDLDRIVGIILQESTQLTGAQHGAILISKDSGTESQNLTTLMRLGSKDQEAQIQKMCMIVAGWVLKNQESVFENAILSDARFKGLKLLEAPLRSVVAVPIQNQGEVIGVLILHSGSDEFSGKDFRLANIVASQCAPVLENARVLRQLQEENRHLRHEVERKYAFQEIVGRSPAMQRVFELLEKIIPTDARVLIQGESGTGKELIARAIHYNGPRKQRRFVAIDCGALPENLLESELFGHVRGAFTGATESKKGLFQTADEGSIFLDEINNTSAALQAKLLRVVQEGEIRPVGSTQTQKVDVRVIVASSQDLAQAVEAGLFRQDLYFRLKVVTVNLPPLRERVEDIDLLANFFLAKYAKAYDKNIDGLTRPAVELLKRHPWPGNVRELENVVESCVVLAEPDSTMIDVEMLPEEFHSAKARMIEGLSQEPKSLNAAVEELERALVSRTLQDCNGNRTRAAESLGLSRRGLLNKIERYGLE